MAIDGCQRKFIELTLEELPRNLKTLRRDAEHRRQMDQFCVQGNGFAALRGTLGHPLDFSGCYALFDNNSPRYVGISRKVLGRLRQHVLGKTHYDASLAYRMACKKIEPRGTRNEAMQDVEFHKAFVSSQEYIRSLTCAYVEIENPLELYLFEAFCAMELDTHEWNTFVTH